MTNLVFVDVLSEGLLKQVDLEQVPLGQVLLGKADLELVYQDQQEWDLLVGLEQGLQVQGVLLVDLPFL